ncbi:MAG: sugar transferase, partial [Anaerolineales bacterium]|nr:sugar transferase [Anaerolineales bacterium]
RSGERRLLLVLGDLVAASTATFIALLFLAQLDWLGLSAQFVRERAGWFVLLPTVWLLLMLNQYDVHRAASWRQTLRGVLLAAAAGVVLYSVVYFTSEPGSLPRRGVLYFLLATTLLTLTWRLIYVRIFTAPAFLRRVLIAGAGLSGRTLLSVLRDLRPQPFFTAGLVDDDPAKQGTVIEGVPVLGDSPHLLQLVQEHDVSEVVVAITGRMNGGMFQALLDAQERGVEITRMAVTYEDLLGRVPIRHLESDWVLRSFVDEVRVSGVYLLAKRLIDLCGALAGLFTLALFFPWVAVAILLESGRPILFPQARLGQGGRPYSVIKFRTMRQDAEADGQAHWAKAGDPRTTRVGAILRKMHLDEFPQFWNVLTGEMSLVGPRPERPELVAELEKQIPFYRARLLAKPGLSGWAQINYGKGASVEGSAEKLEYDLYYIKHRNLWMDLWILLRTIGSVLGLRGV